MCYVLCHLCSTNRCGDTNAHWASIGRLGQPLQLTEGHENLFLHALDNPVVDTASKQEVFSGFQCTKN